MFILAEVDLNVKNFDGRTIGHLAGEEASLQII